MKISLNNRNVILKQYVIKTVDCSQCCFFHNFGLCSVLELRDYAICGTVKVFDKTELNEVFKL